MKSKTPNVMCQTIVDPLPKLTPTLHSWIQSFLGETNLHQQLVTDYGSPLNLHHVDPFIENYQAYAKVIESFGLSHLVFFARKANKCKVFVNTAKNHGFGVDTASFEELNQCLSMGVDPAKLVLTAAIKTNDVLVLAIKNQVLIVVDNQDEIDAIKNLAASMNIVARVALRVSGFLINGEKMYSRFGFDINQIETVVTEYVCTTQHLSYQGMHFHLNGYEIEERVAAFDQLFDVVDSISAMGLSTKFIDMGGGFLTNYLEREEEWNHFQAELKLALAGERSPITFQNNGLGYSWSNGTIEGQLLTYPYYNPTPKEHMLRQILESPTAHGTVAQGLVDRNIELRLEPGRSLVDQTGITLAKVVFRKRDSNGDLLVGLEMNKTQLCSSSADFLLDPILIPINRKESVETDSVENAYLVGAYCLETDVLLKRKIAFPSLPQIGDLVCFPNTAGYMMHFYESQSHLFELAENLIISTNPTGLSAFKVSMEK
ncbi:Y4yA family PLP-dependent enzyme [Reichenbachiella agarivorans]|uniref:Y4yA family PLP-dependent enzyme n=1 Tax=Reichenbachiella agarivorans TaxID=2979464 RepID=A0ABY6CR89_9BACT|nr:Y4yA family PLP-dependent enzyme [Reichenbachiella agarivorans]UXP33017.1 Y4yA family PLP-dependent enzyme [Reichenbachiella agarivorans]